MIKRLQTCFALLHDQDKLRSKKSGFKAILCQSFAALALQQPNLPVNGTTSFEFEHSKTHLEAGRVEFLLSYSGNELIGDRVFLFA